MIYACRPTEHFLRRIFQICRLAVVIVTFPKYARSFKRCRKQTHIIFAKLVRLLLIAVMRHRFIRKILIGCPNIRISPLILARARILTGAYASLGLQRVVDMQNVAILTRKTVKIGQETRRAHNLVLLIRNEIIVAIRTRFFVKTVLFKQSYTLFLLRRIIRRFVRIFTVKILCKKLLHPIRCALRSICT